MGKRVFILLLELRSTLILAVVSKTTAYKKLYFENFGYDDTAATATTDTTQTSSILSKPLLPPITKPPLRATVWAAFALTYFRIEPPNGHAFANADENDKLA